MIYNESKYNQQWDTKKLSDLGTFERGKSKHRPRNDERLFEGGGYPLVQTGEIKDANLYITHHAQEYGEFGLNQSKLWDADTLCITIAANIAETALLSYPMCFPDSVVGFKAYKDVSSEKFMYYVFEYIRRSIQNSVTGSIQDNINIEYLTSLNFKIPSKKIQDTIVSLLSAIDEKILINTEINDYLCEQIQLIFSYLFNLSTVPETWSKGVLSDIADITMGQSPSGNSYNIIGEGCPFYQGSTDFGPIFPAIRMYTNKPSRYASALDTLLSVRAPVGSLNIAFEDCCIGRGLASIHGKNDNNIFVRYLLKNNRWYFDNINNSGTTFGSITKDYLFGMPITIPDDKIVALFEQQSSLIEQQIYVNEQQTRELQSIRNWLLPMLMSGQATIADSTK